MRARLPLRVEVLRGPLVENSHEIVFVIMSHTGVVLNCAGNLDYVVYPRSTVKPLQALSFVESGAIQKYGLGLEHIALACSSHKAEKQHLDLLQKWANLVGVSASNLICENGSLSHNCSGKHFAMISSCAAIGEKVEDYFQPKSPEQIRIRKILTDLSQIDHEKAISALDGCGLQTTAMPLQNLALAFTSFFSDSIPDLRRKALSVILQAMQKHPELVSGRGTLVTEVIEATHGNVILKSGADGVYVGFCLDQHFTFALKCVDGSQKAAEYAVMWLLKTMKALNESQIPTLKHHLYPALMNSRGEKTGEMRVVEQ